MVDQRKGKIPADAGAEAAVLSACISDVSSWERAAEALVDGAHGQHPFTVKAHQAIWDAACAQGSEGLVLSHVTVASRLESMGRLDDAGGRQMLMSLAAAAPKTIPELGEHLDVVRRRWRQRQMLTACKKAAALIAMDADPDVVAESLVDEIEMGAGGGDEGPVTMHVAAADALRKSEILAERRLNGDTGPSGIPTGLLDLDGLLDGLQRRQVTVAAGSPGTGKSVLGANVADNAASHGFHSLMFSLEMPADAMGARTAASIARVNLGDLRSGRLGADEDARTRRAITRLADLPLWVDDRFNLTANHIAATCRRHARRNGPLDLVIIDHLHHVDIDPGERERLDVAYGRVMKKFIGIARKHDCAVLLLAQLSRKLSERADKRPQLTDLKESSAIEQLAYAVVGLYRDELYNPDTEDAGLIEMRVLKNRDGETGTVKGAFLGQYGLIANAAIS